MLRKELDDLAAGSNGRFVVYVSAPLSHISPATPPLPYLPCYASPVAHHLLYLPVTYCPVIIPPAIAHPQHVLNNPPAGWTQGTGFITKEIIEQHQPDGGVGSPEHGVGPKVLLCGPPPMMSAMK